MKSFKNHKGLFLECSIMIMLSNFTNIFEIGPNSVQALVILGSLCRLGWLQFSRVLSASATKELGLKVHGTTLGPNFSKSLDDQYLAPLPLVRNLTFLSLKPNVLDDQANYYKITHIYDI